MIYILSFLCGVSLFLSVFTLSKLTRSIDEYSEIVSNLALTVAKLDVKEEKTEQERDDAAKLWEDAVNNLMSYELKNYGLDVSFLHKEDDVNG